MLRFVFPTVTRRYCKKNPTAINKEQVELVTLRLLTSFFIWLSGILAVIVKCDRLMTSFGRRRLFLSLTKGTTKDISRYLC
mgnify:CR=1 FL=1